MEPIDATIVSNSYVQAVVAQKLTQYLKDREQQNDLYYRLVATRQVWVIDIKYCKFNSKKGFSIDYCTLRNNGDYFTASTDRSPLDATQWDLPRCIKVINSKTYTMVTFSITHDIEPGELTLGWNDAIFKGQHRGENYALTLSLEP